MKLVKLKLFALVLMLQIKNCSLISFSVFLKIFFTQSTLSHVGVWLDAYFPFLECIQGSCKACFVQIYRFHGIRQNLTHEADVLAANYLVSNHLEYCNSLLEVCYVFVYPSCRLMVFTILLHVLSQTIGSMIMSEASSNISTGCLVNYPCKNGNIGSQISQQWYSQLFWSFIISEQLSYIPGMGALSVNRVIHC